MLFAGEYGMRAEFAWQLHAFFLRLDISKYRRQWRRETDGHIAHIMYVTILQRKDL
jgi:hypothetical protein